eukprot:sb/3462052/
MDYLSTFDSDSDSDLEDPFLGAVSVYENLLNKYSAVPSRRFSAGFELSEGGTFEGTFEGRFKVCFGGVFVENKSSFQTYKSYWKRDVVFRIRSEAVPPPALWRVRMNMWKGSSGIFSLSSVASSGSVSSDSKMSITSDECRGPRQPQAKPPPKIIPSGKPPRHHADPSGPTGVPVVHPRKSLNTRPDSMNSDSGIIGSSGSDTSQSRWSWLDQEQQQNNSNNQSGSGPAPTTPTAAAGIGDDKKLKLVVEELVKSENDYVLSLDYIVRQYTAHLMKHKLWSVHPKLLGNIEEIYRFHRELFLPDLLQCGGDPLKVAGVFMKHRAKYDLHVQYCRNKPRSEAVYSEHEQDLEQVQKVLNQSLSLSAFLIKPVQRITKYQLLLAEILKFGRACGLSGLDQVEAAHGVMLEVPRKANNWMHLEMFEDPPEDTLIHQDTLTVSSGSAIIQAQGKPRQVFLFKHSLVLTKHEMEGKKLKSYTAKTVIDLTNCVLTTEEETVRFAVSTTSTGKFWFSALNQAQKTEWVRLLKTQIEYCQRERERGSVGSNNSNEENKKNNKMKLRFHKRRKSLTKITLREDGKEGESDWAQPYITGSNRIPSDQDLLKGEDYERCISKLSNISMSIDHINLIPSEHPVQDTNTNRPPTPPIAQKTGYKFLNTLFYGHFSMFCTCEHLKTGLKFTVQVTPVKDRQFLRSIQREIDILQSLNFKRVSRLHEVQTDYKDCVCLIMSYQYQLPLLDFVLLKESHRELDTVEMMRALLEGVWYLHTRNIAHLDIKPENLIWDKTTVKLINYELAHYVEDENLINYELAHYVEDENVYLETSMLDDEFGAPELLLGRVSSTAADIW